MSGYFTRERFGRPQFLAGLLLLAFFAQAVWLVHVELSAGDAPDALETIRIREGLKQWHGGGVAGTPFGDVAGNGPTRAILGHEGVLVAPGSVSDPIHYPGEDVEGYEGEHSPLLYLLTAAPLLARPSGSLESSGDWGWLPRLPFLACGMLLGASLWYVARRLCGNAGGFVALTLYCFSPGMIQASAVWHTEPEIVAVWGAFGTVFTAIAVAHTLYAPREVILWNWRRILLLGVALALAVGSQFSMIVVVPMALAFLLYVAPVRRGAGTVIWLAASIIGLVLLFVIYSFHGREFSAGMHHAIFWGVSWRGFVLPGVYKQVARQLARGCPALAFLFPVAVVVYAGWPRTRYFGNTAPLSVGVLFVVLGIAHPHVAGAGFLLSALPFLLSFVSGVVADVMETRQRMLATACVLGMLSAYALWSVLALAHAPRG
jgi:Dolichyl-phosphate-mannose-protein mannosyltransferase